MRSGRATWPCPNCRETGGRLLRRKYVVTALRECSGCGLRFRTPTDDPIGAVEFYQGDYSQGFTTDVPGPEELARLIATEFRGSQKDFRPYLAILNAAGLQSGAAVLDYGSSWGYGSWQFKRAGFDVFSFEIGADRAAYGVEKLGCKAISDPAEVEGQMDCVFSSHVLEHITEPRKYWADCRRALKPSGVVVTLMPNGDPDRLSRVAADQYHKMWGKVHPILLSRRSLHAMAKEAGMIAHVHSSPYNEAELRSGQDSAVLDGDELLIIARKESSSRG